MNPIMKILLKPKTFFMFLELKKVYLIYKTIPAVVVLELLVPLHYLDKRECLTN